MRLKYDVFNIMRKFLIILSACFFFSPLSAANGEEGLHINGYDWEKWSTGSKIAFVQGWAKCGKAALDNMAIDVNKWNESIEFANLQQESYKNTGVLLGGVTIGQIVDTIDIIYSDPRVKLMDINDIMPLVSGRLLQGWTMSELDGLIAIKVKLWRCEKEEKKKRQFNEECSSLRKEINLYLKNLKK